MLDPVSDIPLEVLEMRKKYAKAIALHTAMAVTEGSSPSDYIVREIVPGDKTNAVDFCDLDMKTPVEANCQYWGLDAADQTTNTASDWLESQTIDSGKWMVFTGMFDQCPVANVPADGVGGAPLNTVSRVTFKRGGSPILIWGTQLAYAQGDAVVAFGSELAMFEQNITPQIQTIVNEATIDKPFGLRGYLIEKRGTINPLDHFDKQIVPNEAMTIDPGDGMGARPLPIPLGGFEPIQETPLAKIAAIKQRCIDGLVAMAVRDNAIDAPSVPGTVPNDALIMEVLVGSPTASSDNDVYLTNANTEYAAGIMMYALDASEQTTLQLSRITDATADYNAIPKLTYAAIFGMADNTNIPKLNAVRFKVSDTVLDFWHVQHMYAYKNPSGITERPIFYGQNKKAVIEVRCGDTEQDIFPVFRTMILMNKSNRIGGA